MDEEEKRIAELLADSRTIAVVGLSPRPDRPSYEVAEYLQAQGYRIIPVNPMCAGTSILGEHCYASLSEAAAATGAIDIVDCFRKSEYISALVDEAIAIEAHCVWMQLGVIDRAAGARAEQAGLLAVIDKCIKIEHMRLI